MPTPPLAGDGFDFGIEATPVVLLPLDPSATVALPVVAVAAPVPAGFVNGRPS